jgi:uncharacterized membrane protein
MSQLVVIGFKHDISRAAAVLGELRERDEAWTQQLHDAIAVYRTSDGVLEVDQSFESTRGESAITHGMAGSLVGLALAALALPLTGGLSGAAVLGGAAAGAVGGSIVGAHHGKEATWWKHELAIPESFFEKVRATVLAGDSAIFMLLPAADTVGLADRFSSFGGTVLAAELDAAQNAKLGEKLVTAKLA